MSKPRYSQQRVITEHELTARPGTPSQILRETEATLIGELARSVALSGHQFDGWPTVTLGADLLFRGNGWVLRAEVDTR